MYIPQRLILFATFTALVWTGCGTEPSTDDDATWATIDYDRHTYGLITPDTLEGWLLHWQESRPADVEGDLVVLQLGVRDDAPPVAASHQETGVRVYDISEDVHVLIEPRNNGLFAAGEAPARGVRIDAYLRKYDIDPRDDLIVFVPGSLADDTRDTLSMAWLAMRYWGLDEKHLAIVNGDVGDLSNHARANEALEAPYDGTTRVLSLPSTHFSITLNVGDVRAWVQERPDDTLLWDVRTRDEFDGRALSAAPRDRTCIAGAPACTAAFGGRIAGAQHLDYTDFLDETGRIQQPNALQTLFANNGITRDTTHFLYDADGAHSATIAFILLGVTGHNARWYPNSFVEWSALNAAHPEPKRRALKEDNDWRTDTEVFTESLSLWADAAQTTHPIVINSKTTATDAVETEDQRYLARPPALPVVDLDSPDCF